jgi:hypothetical protein
MKTDCPLDKVIFCAEPLNSSPPPVHKTMAAEGNSKGQGSSEESILCNLNSPAVPGNEKTLDLSLGPF